MHLKKDDQIFYFAITGLVPIVANFFLPSRNRALFLVDDKYCEESKLFENIVVLPNSDKN